MSAQYAQQTFVQTFMQPHDSRPPVPPAEALTEIGAALATLPGVAADAARAAADAVQAFEDSQLGSPKMRELAGRVFAAVDAGEPTAGLEDELAALYRAAPANMAAAVVACARAAAASEDAHARVHAAVEQSGDELATLCAVLAGEVHDCAVAAEQAGDSIDGFRRRQQMVETERRWCRIIGVLNYARGGRGGRHQYLEPTACPATALDWEPDQPLPVKSTGVWRSLIGARR